jgi:hypothetical protein
MRADHSEGRRLRAHWRPARAISSTLRRLCHLAEHSGLRLLAALAGCLFGMCAIPVLFLLNNYSRS